MREIISVDDVLKVHPEIRILDKNYERESDSFIKENCKSTKFIGAYLVEYTIYFLGILETSCGAYAYIIAKDGSLQQNTIYRNTKGFYIKTGKKNFYLKDFA